MDYQGSNSLDNLKGLTKDKYSKKISYNVPGMSFKKLKKLLKGK